MSMPTTEVQPGPQPQELPASAAVTKHLVVKKFGGSSVADAEGIKRVARRVVDAQNAGNEVVVVVSAMGDTTDELLDLAGQVTDSAPAREMDMLLSAGERISMALLAMAINKFGASAQSFTGSQAGMITDGIHGKARIIDVDPHRIRTALDKGHIAIVAGFQGMSRTTNEITTLGRGGSDTTAVALAAALDADVCEIYTDVDGIYTADPRVVPSAQKIDTISSEEMLELAASGAKILHLRCVEYARRFGVPLHVRSSFSQNEGTWVLPSADDKITIQEGVALEQPIISGVAHDRSEAKVTVVGVPDIPGKAAAIFQVIAGRALEHRHDRPERLHPRHRQDGHLLHAAHRRRRRSPGRPPRRAGRDRLREHRVQREDRQAVADRRRHALPPGRFRHASSRPCPTPASTST